MARAAAGRDLTGRVDRAAVQQQLLRERGLAGVRVRDDREGTPLGDRVRKLDRGGIHQDSDCARRRKGCLGPVRSKSGRAPSWSAYTRTSTRPPAARSKIKRCPATKNLATGGTKRRLSPRTTTAESEATSSVQSATRKRAPAGTSAAPLGNWARANVGLPLRCDSWWKHSGSADRAHGASPRSGGGVRREGSRCCAGPGEAVLLE